MFAGIKEKAGKLSPYAFLYCYFYHNMSF